MHAPESGLGRLFCQVHRVRGLFRVGSWWPEPGRSAAPTSVSARPFEPGYALGMQSVRTEAGKPLRLVHGTSNLHNWDLVVPALARERTVIAIDLPGFGEAHL